VLHFQPSRWDYWSQQLEVTVGELLSMEGFVTLKVSFWIEHHSGKVMRGIASIRSAMPMVEMDILSAVINTWPTLINAESILNAQPFWW
jgi:hypothetical protein